MSACIYPVDFLRRRSESLNVTEESSALIHLSTFGLSRLYKPRQSEPFSFLASHHFTCVPMCLSISRTETAVLVSDNGGSEPTPIAQKEDKIQPSSGRTQYYTRFIFQSWVGWHFTFEEWRWTCLSALVYMSIICSLGLRRKEKRRSANATPEWNYVKSSEMARPPIVKATSWRH